MMRFAFSSQLLLCWIILLADTGGLAAQEPRDRLVRLKDSRNPVRASAYNELLLSRQATVGGLINLLDEAENFEPIYGGTLDFAIALLGKLRAPEAVEPLAEHLLFVPDEFLTTEAIVSERYFVATSALVEIGQPAVEPMISIIYDDSDAQRRRLAAWVLMKVLGEGEAIARLEDRYKPGGFGSERFEAAIEFIKNYQPEFRHPYLTLRPERQ